MKNLLLNKLRQNININDSIIHINLETSTIDKALAEALTDSSEIDLSPPRPIINTKGMKNMSNMVQFKEVMYTRKSLLKSKCLSKKKRQILNYRVFYPLPKKSFVWCPVYKASSTNWMHNLLHLAGKKESEIKKIVKDHPSQPNDQARAVAPILSLSKLRQLATSAQFKGMFVVRHPFDRLVSAYRDKIERCHGPDNTTLKGEWYYKTYGKKIVSKYRNGAIQRFGPEYFSEDNNFGSPLPISSGWRSSSLPSWWEFVQYILHTQPTRYDEHWKPFSIYCAVCSFPYTHILHFENIQTEEKFFAEEMTASDLVHPRWENRNDEGLAKEDILNKYFSILDDDEIQDLYKIYEDDFRFFGYQFEYRGIELNKD